LLYNLSLKKWKFKENTTSSRTIGMKPGSEKIYAENFKSPLIYVILFFIGTIFNGCAGLTHVYLSSPKAEGAVEKSQSVLCPSQGLHGSRPSFIQFEFKKIDICIESETPLDQDHYYLIGPAFLVFLPFIPAPYGVYDFLFSPRHKKHSEDILLILKRKEGQLSLDLAKAMLLRANHNEAHPVSVKCPIDQHLVTYCHVIFDSKDWSFSLLIGEIKIDGQPIIVPAIHFNRASGWSAQVIR